MNYHEACDYLGSALRFGIRLGLERMTGLMALLGHPERRLKVIHIAGTNGKGSVSAYCASILAAAGHRTGVFTSPYLVRLTERIRIIDGPESLSRLVKDETTGEIGHEAFAALMTEVRQAVDQMLADGWEHPTEFELLTAAGFLHFARQACDVVVLETGLGGRFDSTNVVEKPLAAIITALGYDHMDRLGPTIALIAAEKAGIVKRGCPLYLYDPDALLLSVTDRQDIWSVITGRCRHMDADLHVVRADDVTTESYDADGQVFSDRLTGLRARTSLLGLFQPMNAVLAMRVCRDLKLADDQQIMHGISLARWPARLELLRKSPPVLIDGAHNPQGCQALAAGLARLLPGQTVVYLCGMLSDKDYHTMLRTILLESDTRPAAMICVEPDSPRALSREALARAARSIWRELPDLGISEYNDPVRTADTPADGARMALQLANACSCALCAFGSLYLVGSIRQILSDAGG